MNLQILILPITVLVIVAVVVRLKTKGMRPISRVTIGVILFVAAYFVSSYAVVVFEQSQPGIVTTQGPIQVFPSAMPS